MYQSKDCIELSSKIVCMLIVAEFQLCNFLLFGWDLHLFFLLEKKFQVGEDVVAELSRAMAKRDVNMRVAALVSSLPLYFNNQNWKLIIFIIGVY